MNGRNLIICDQEMEYASRLAKYLEGKKELALQVKICDSPEQAALIRRESGAEILLIDERISVDKKELQKIPQVIWLSSSVTGKKEDEDVRRIFRYQKSENIYAGLVQVLAESGAGVNWGIHKKERGKLIGVYSPVRRLGQTAFAISKGMELAKTENVLYVNLESYAGFGGYFPEEKEKNLSMLLYYAKQELGNPGLLIAMIVKHLGRFYYFKRRSQT